VAKNLVFLPAIGLAFLKWACIFDGEILHLSACMDTTSRIFVQIASYRDTECQHTVRDLFEKASHPDRITVGICWQFFPERDAACFELETRPQQVRVVKVHAKESQGVCWARRQTQELWQGEDYTLQIDSHMRFVPGWDVRMIAQLEQCDLPNPVLSSYPARYTPPDRLDPHKITVKRPQGFNAKGELRCIGMELSIPPQRPLRGAFVAAGYMFSHASIISAVPYDPYLYFMEEEPLYSARLYTHGWNVFSPSESMLYHFYNDVGDRKIRPLHWGDVKGWDRYRDRGRRRYRHMIGQDISDDPDVTAQLDVYGFGTARSLEDFYQFSGVNLHSCELSERGWKCEFVGDITRYLKAPLHKPTAIL